MGDGGRLEHGGHLGRGHHLPGEGEVAAAQGGLGDVSGDALASESVQASAYQRGINGFVRALVFAVLGSAVHTWQCW